MATKDLTNSVSWLDIWKTENTDGTMLTMANELVENNALLAHAVWVKANSKTQHKDGRVAYLPTSSTKRAGDGTAPTAGGHEQFIEETKVRETWIEIEDEVLQKASNPEAYMSRQCMLALQGIQQDAVQEWIYGSRNTDPDSINGLALRMPSLQADRKLGKVVSAGGSGGANSSLWGIKWGVDDGVYFIYPEDHPMAGVDMEVFPAENKRDSNGKLMRVVTARIQWAYGIAVKNRRAIFRLANIDASITPANWILNVENKLVELFNDCPADGAGFRLYANNFCKTQFDIRTKDKGNVWMNTKDPYGQNDRATTMFGQNPIHKVERLIATEANVS